MKPETHKCTCPPCEEPKKQKKTSSKLMKKCIDLDIKSEKPDDSYTTSLCYRAPCLEPECCPSPCYDPCLPVPCVSVDCQCCCNPPMMDEEMMVCPEKADKENYIIPQPCPPCPPCGAPTACCPPPSCPPCCAPCCPPSCCPSCCD